MSTSKLSEASALDVVDRERWRPEASDVINSGSTDKSNKIEQAVAIGMPERFGRRVSRKLAIKKGHKLSERVSWSNMSIAVISGICLVQCSGKVAEVQVGQALHIQANDPHEIQAVSDCRAIVTFDID
ncbi:MAG: hypothetical protein AAFN77_19345 [Planctomycetota bacterium]